MSSSTMRAATVGMTLPTDPRFRIASSPRSMHVTGDISVWPNAARILLSGNVSDISRSRVSDAGGAAPPGQRTQPDVARLGLLRRADRLPLGGHQEDTGDPLGLEHVEQLARVESAQRWMTVGVPSIRPPRVLPIPAMWNSGTPPMNPTSLLMSGPVVYIPVIAWPARLVWVSTAPLGRPVVPEVYMINAGLSLGMSTGWCCSPSSTIRSS